ncbi:hypothetical protein EVAR_47214_1 [Eumeta japonica]|uniref:Uncharacterized protein n=1 Tax=Eumeta variegata TaxID=151549 RepID=A0A4C1XW33_EUMVA|nr:hypothetical protein EVAR_47214_1 [Eumeta japonica]
MDEIMKALKRIKVGKAAGYDKVWSETLRGGGDIMASLFICEESRKDRRRNSDVTERCGLKEDVVTRVERGILQWFGHLERMNEYRLTKQIYRANVCNGKICIREDKFGAMRPRAARPSARRVFATKNSRLLIAERDLLISFPMFR